MDLLLYFSSHRVYCDHDEIKLDIVTEYCRSTLLVTWSPKKLPLGTVTFKLPVPVCFCTRLVIGRFSSVSLYLVPLSAYTN
jgi:hypothetical protein